MYKNERRESFRVSLQQHSSTYDANGNTLSDAQGRSFTWDFENRLTQVVNPGVGTTTFKYDPFGRRSLAGVFRSRTHAVPPTTLYNMAYLVDELDNTRNVLAPLHTKLALNRRIPARRTSLRGAGCAIHLQSVSWFTNAFPDLFVPSVALHVVEFTFCGGFESLPLRHYFLSSTYKSVIPTVILRDIPFSGYPSKEQWVWPNNGATSPHSVPIKSST